MTRRAVATSVLVPILALTLAACGGSSGEEANVGTPPPSVEASPTPTPTPTSTDPAEPARSERGNIIKAPGELAGLLNPDSSTALEFTVNSITVDPECSGEYATPPDHGHFIVVDLEVQTMPTLTTGASFHPSSWTLIDAEGYTLADSGSAASFGCLADSEYLPAQIGPGQKARGKVVLDSPSDHGVLIYTPIGYTNGWEWSF